MRLPKVRYILSLLTILIFFPLILFTIHPQNTANVPDNDFDGLSDGSSVLSDDKHHMNSKIFDKENIINLLKHVESISGEKTLSKNVDSETNIKMRLIEAVLSMIEHTQDLQDTHYRTLHNKKTIVNEKEKFIDPSLLELLPADLKWFQNGSSTFEPKYHLGHNNANAKFIFGVPTVYRPKESYLLSTLKNLFDNLTPAEKSISQFVLFIGETKDNMIEKILFDVRKRFQEEIDTGLLEIISPPEQWYPDLTNLRKTLNDNPSRVRWRTKQNLDFAYLWLFARTKPGRYYVQLEDDIVAKPSYVLSMMNFIKARNAIDPNWMMLDFCSLGFIGKLFRITDLLGFVVQYLLFYNDKPVDWLLADYFRTKVCSLDETPKKCNMNIRKIWIGQKPSLFQHVGTYSSLEGKIQKLQDKQFVKHKIVMKAHDNPDADVNTTLSVYMANTFDKIYHGLGVFWSYPPTDRDYLRIVFKAPQTLKKILIVSGNYLHIADIFPGKTSIELRSANSTEFRALNNAVQSGRLDANIDPSWNPIDEICIRFNENATSWFLISEIEIIKL